MNDTQSKGCFGHSLLNDLEIEDTTFERHSTQPNFSLPFPSLYRKRGTIFDQNLIMNSYYQNGER